MTRPGTWPEVAVGVDGSETSIRALEWAAREARRRGVTLGVIHAYPFNLAAATPEDPPALRAAAERLLTEAADRAGQVAGEITVVRALLDGPPDTALVHESEEVSLLVVGGRGAGGFADLLLGSTAEKVATRASCPVVVVPRGYVTAPGGRRGAPVVVGTDASRGADCALEFAFTRAHETGAAVVVLHAWQLPYSYCVYPGRQSSRTEETAAERRARAALADAVAPWLRRYPTVDVDQLAVLGHPVQTLAEASAEAEVVVVGSRGLGALGGMLLGSVSQALLRHAQCPVVVAR